MASSAEAYSQNFDAAAEAAPDAERLSGKKKWLIPLVLVALLAGGGIAAWQLTKSSEVDTDGTFASVSWHIPPHG